MRISDWSSDVCSSDLIRWTSSRAAIIGGRASVQIRMKADAKPITPAQTTAHVPALDSSPTRPQTPISARSEEHTSELQSLMRISYAVFCLKKKKKSKITSKRNGSYKTTLLNHN